ncbi:MAG: TetR/AcrR family transcriptional regulator [Spirochaetaceae bacterium]|jgi:AcrR family transcriptional regulator|nr:TetR/AcrR family transcriptional regulator [Spirochaetaceae bacterium]
MGIVERKGREKAERRALIMGCAKELILEHGAEAVSMMDIANRAELSKATLYLYFSSKEILFKELLWEEGDRFIEYVRSRIRPHASALDALQTLWASFIRLFGESGDMFIILYVWNYIAPIFPFFAAEMEDEAQSAPMGIYFLVKEIIEQGIREGVFDSSVNGGTVAHMIITLFSHIDDNSVRVYPGSPPGTAAPYPVVREIKSIFEIVLRGIAREGTYRSVLVLPDQPDGGGPGTARARKPKKIKKPRKTRNVRRPRRIRR